LVLEKSLYYDARAEKHQIIPVYRFMVSLFTRQLVWFIYDYIVTSLQTFLLPAQWIFLS